MPDIFDTTRGREAKEPIYLDLTEEQKKELKENGYVIVKSSASLKERSLEPSDTIKMIRQSGDLTRHIMKGYGELVSDYIRFLGKLTGRKL